MKEKGKKKKTKCNQTCPRKEEETKGQWKIIAKYQTKKKNKTTAQICNSVKDRDEKIYQKKKGYRSSNLTEDAEEENDVEASGKGSDEGLAAF